MIHPPPQGGAPYLREFEVTRAKRILISGRRNAAKLQLNPRCHIFSGDVRAHDIGQMHKEIVSAAININEPVFLLFSIEPDYPAGQLSILTHVLVLRGRVETNESL